MRQKDTMRQKCDSKGRRHINTTFEYPRHLRHKSNHLKSLTTRYHPRWYWGISDTLRTSSWQNQRRIS